MDLADLNILRGLPRHVTVVPDGHTVIPLLRLQKWGRALMVRRAFYHLFVLEDKAVLFLLEICGPKKLVVGDWVDAFQVLLRPKPAHLAMKFLLPEAIKMFLAVPSVVHRISFSFF